MRTKHSNELHSQMRRRVKKPVEKKPEYDGDFGTVISTGSTLLDLAISGGRIKGGGLGGGIFVEAFGPSSAGKTVLLCEIAGAVQRQGGIAKFHDPEARLNKQFVRQFDFQINEENYSKPDRVPEVFKEVREWNPKNKGVNGIFADSLAALSTDLEMDNKDGDKMGSRRAKEFSEELRKTCRIIQERNFLMVASNQIREKMGAGQYEEKYKSPGGEAIAFYASLRLKFGNPSKIIDEQAYKGKKVKKVIGVTTTIDVYKSSVWKPYRSAPITIIFDYGIDDIRENLKFVKKFTNSTVYTVLGRKLDKSLDESIKIIEQENLEKKLKYETIEIWEEIERKFDSNRKKKVR